jgi:hypothetical protein
VHQMRRTFGNWIKSLRNTTRARLVAALGVAKWVKELGCGGKNILYCCSMIHVDFVLVL